ncbi:hypothetical protein SADUNF_Sadunf02G0082600 [Salix dunnii]|uniref:beta-N-acetylhexosaminidase n=1 Tax=Salix dunnii TaxID=1413687 RepID=A0A835TG91_9ROSI|nr:hypothetical protein SADUNF_Sadunf02G0082600 [Salix dunnii]
MKLCACDLTECMNCVYLLNIELTSREESCAYELLKLCTLTLPFIFSSVIFQTFSHLCAFDYETKTVQYKAPWYIVDKPRFAYCGLLLDTSRHYLSINVIKQIIESMSYAKLNVLHWHIIDEQSFPLEVPSYPNLWKGSYTKWERYTVEDAYDIVK